MLYWLADILKEYFPVFGVFGYLSFRAIVGVLTALGISMMLGPWVIRTLEQLQVGQSIREDGPKSHLSKSGTPTMGGALILFAIGLSTVLWSDLSNRYVQVVLFVTFSFGAIGWVHDYRKVVEKNFDTYTMLGLHECPEIEVHVNNSTEPPEGAGESGLANVAPSLTGATMGPVNTMRPDSRSLEPRGIITFTGMSEISSTRPLAPP